jgi:hypothetical protein
MGGLREKLAGLERFRELDVPAPEPFDRHRADRMIRTVLAKVEGIYLPGALDWAREHRPDLWAAETLAMVAVDVAYLAKDMVVLREALAAFGGAVREVLSAFKAATIYPAATVPAEEMSLFPEEAAAGRRASAHRGAL